MLNVGIVDKKASVDLALDRCEIGEGFYAARVLLNHRGYDPVNVDLATACYLVYEAKKFSESVDTVGPRTWLKVHAQGGGDLREPTRHCYMDIDSEGLETLEGWRGRFFLQSPKEVKGTLFRHFS